METNTHRVALVGSPNSGKTSLFNWLTGRKQKVVNYPGSTVDVAVGFILPNLVSGDSALVLEIMDTPGTYSLFPKSPDEEVTLKALMGQEMPVEKIIAVLDATQLRRQLPLIRQLQETKIPFVVAVTMHDLHAKEKCRVELVELEKEFSTPFIAVDGILGGGVRELVAALVRLPKTKAVEKIITPWSTERFDQELIKSRQLAQKVAKEKLAVHEKTEKLDRIFLHPALGGLIFFAVMGLLFSSIYWAAAPLMDFVDGGFSSLADWTHKVLGEGLLSGFLSDGIMLGLGAVLVFVPQILILFLGITVLEDSGYLARAATIVDKPLSAVGLNGKAFVPLLSGFACAVPAMMSARAVNSKKERWLTMMIIPLMTCSARLPVYALLISFLFFDKPLFGGILMASLYVGAVLVAAIVAGVLGRFVKGERSSFFIMELPLYRLPRWGYVIKSSLLRTRAYIVKTGPVILVLSVLLWVLSTFPNYNEQDAKLRFQSSYLTVIGQNIEPVFEPMGVDWRVGVGLLTAFAAREVFVSSLAVVMNVEEVEDEDTLRETLVAQMQSAKFADGRAVFTTASVAALLVFFMIALQCISTSAVALREMASMRFALLQLVGLNLLAYVLAVLTYQTLSHIL